MGIIIKDYGQTAEQVQDATGEKMTTGEMQEKYTVEGFSAPYVTVKRKSDGASGSLEFGHSPRVYFNWKQDI